MQTETFFVCVSHFPHNIIYMSIITVVDRALRVENCMLDPHEGGGGGWRRGEREGEKRQLFLILLVIISVFICLHLQVFVMVP